MKTLIRRPSPALLVAFLALFVALTGGAYAVVTAPENSVVSSSIKDREVKSADIGYNAVAYNELANNSVLSEKVLDNNLRGQDVFNESLTGDDIDNGTVAGADVKEESLLQADLGEGSVRASELYISRHFVSEATGNRNLPRQYVSATCPAGETAISGGAEITGDYRSTHDPVIDAVVPIDDRTWRAGAYAADPDLDIFWGVRLTVLCVAI